VGLLGTSFTMERPFYTGRLKERFGIGAFIPESDERDQVHRIIYQELCRGVVDDSSKHTYLKIMDELVRKGAQAIVLGCTEIGLLVCEEDTDIPLYDTAFLHAAAAVDWMLE
jgi:aspartate racemase